MDKNDINILKKDTRDKQNAIQKATMSGKLTLAIREYGRGTDFICLDKVVEQNGGISII